MLSDLPPEVDREALIDALADLVARRGPQPLGEWPIVLPDEEHFPDRWSPDLAGVETLARRLMSYAGLGHLGVELEAFAESQLVDYSAGPGGISRRTQHQGTAAWFRGIRDGDGTCLFGVEISGMGDPEHLAGVLAHEVAHAYRAHHRLSVADAGREEQLTDLTTVFIGFGVLTTNAADRFRSSSDLVYHRWQRQQAGYLSPAEMSFLLAVQAICRGSSRECRRIKGHLERNQAVSFASSLSWLKSRSRQVRARIGATGPVFRGEARRPVLAPIRAAAGARSPAQDRDRPRTNEGMPVFRLPISRLGIMVRVAVAGAIAGPLLAFLLESPWALLVPPVLMFVLEKLFGNPFCSGCERRVPRAAAVCGSCGGLLVGDIKRPRDRHDAEEDYWAKHGGRPAGMTTAEDVDAEAVEQETPASGHDDDQAKSSP